MLASPALAQAPAAPQQPERRGKGAPAQATPQAGDRDALWARATVLLRAARDREALESLDALIILAPQDGPAHRERALARWRNFLQPAPAASAPDASTFTAFQDQLCRYTSGPCETVRRVLDDLDRAIVLLDGPARATALRDRAEVLAERGEFSRALTDLDAAVPISDSGDLRSQRAMVRLKLGDRAGALADLDAALAKRNDPGDRLSRAGLRGAAGDRRGARADVGAGLMIPYGQWVGELAAMRRALATPGEAGTEQTTTLRVARTAQRRGPDERLRIAITLDRASARRLSAFTAFHLGREAELTMGRRVLLTARIREPIRGGAMEIALSTRDPSSVRAFVDRLGRSKLRLRVVD